MSTWKDLQRRDVSEPRREPKRVAEVVGRLSGRWGLGQPAVIATVFLHWKEIVGELLARHAIPVDVRNGTLRIEVDEAAWATELQFFTAGILERIASISGVGSTDKGGVSAITVRVARNSQTNRGPTSGSDDL
jgi:predicted nucleic acid-binding Zn ribbon protein